MLKRSSQLAKFRNIRNFATLLPVDCFLTRLFVVLYKLSLDVILVYLHIFVIYLLLSTYISSVLLVNQSILQSINQSIKFGTELPLPRLVCDFLSLSFTFLHFLTSQTPLDDEKSRDARLKPLILEGEGHLVLVLRQAACSHAFHACI